MRNKNINYYIKTIQLRGLAQIYQLLSKSSFIRKKKLQQQAYRKTYHPLNADFFQSQSGGLEEVLSFL